MVVKSTLYHLYVTYVRYVHIYVKNNIPKILRANGQFSQSYNFKFKSAANLHGFQWKAQSREPLSRCLVRWLLSTCLKLLLHSRGYFTMFMYHNLVQYYISFKGVMYYNTVISYKYEYCNYGALFIAIYSLQPTESFLILTSTQYTSRVLSCAQIPYQLSLRLQLPLRRTWHAPRRLNTPLPPITQSERALCTRVHRVAPAWRGVPAACCGSVYVF